MLNPFVVVNRSLTCPSQLINAPEVNQVLPDIPVLGDLVKNLYECHYDKFLVALGVFFVLINLCPRVY